MFSATKACLPRIVKEMGFTTLGIEALLHRIHVDTHTYTALHFVLLYTSVWGSPTTSAPQHLHRTADAELRSLAAPTEDCLNACILLEGTDVTRLCRAEAFSRSLLRKCPSYLYEASVEVAP